MDVFVLMHSIENGVAGTDSQRCPYYGIKASQEFAKISTCTVVPLENNGKSGDGTYCSHWAEACLKHELMTGIINYGGNNPLSRITVGALEDLGYSNLDYSAADTYTAADLGTGCNCPRRSLTEITSPLLRSLVTSLVDDLPQESPRTLSEDARQYAYEKGLQFLRQDPTNVASVVGSFFNSTNATKSLDSKEAEYVGNRMVSVLVQDGPGGDIYGVHVLNPNYNPQ
jgi:Leishmanolysin